MVTMVDNNLKQVLDLLRELDLEDNTIVFFTGDNGGQDRFRKKVGLPLATYFSGPKIRWMLDNVEDLRARAQNGDLLFGNTDTWLVWNLTG